MLVIEFYAAVPSIGHSWIPAFTAECRVYECFLASTETGGCILFRFSTPCAYVFVLLYIRLYCLALQQLLRQPVSLTFLLIYC